MSSCCPICYRESEASIIVPKQQLEICQERFFRSLQRYLDGAEESGMQKQLSGIGMVTCGQCMPLMKEFCELYHQLKTIELCINWKVETLKNVMRCAQRVPSRMNNFRNFMKRVDAPERVDDLIKLRRRLIEKCSQKLSDPLPKLSIDKWKLDDEMTSTALLPSKPLEGSKNEIIDSISNKIQFDKARSHLGDDRIDSNPSEIHCQNSLEIISSPPKEAAVAIETTIFGNQRDNLDIDYNDTSGTSMGDGMQFETHLDDDTNAAETELAGHDDSDQGPTNADHRDAGAALAPMNNQSPLSDPLLKSPVLTTKLEAVNTIPTMMEPDTQFPHVSRGIIEIQLENPPELSEDAVSSNTDMLIHGPQIEIISRLRSTHRCQHCGRTFSSNERLQLHQQEAHVNDDDRHDQIESDNDHINGDRNQSDSDDSMSCFSSSSSDDEQDDNLEPDSYHTDTVMELNEKYSDIQKVPSNFDVKLNPAPTLQDKCIIVKPPKPYLYSENEVRFKCPDCSKLFPETKGFLLHRKTSKSCRKSYDATKSVKVEVFAIPKEVTAIPVPYRTIKESAFVDLRAIIELPQEIHICKSCDLAVYSVEDVEAHKKLHGAFKCHFCDVTKTYAPDLALHEREAHQTPETRSSRNPSRNIICVRCGVGSKYRNVYIAHHLVSHLSLTFNDSQCPICRTNSDVMTHHNPGKHKTIKFQIGPHLKTHHDLSNVTNLDDLKNCKAEHCRAYFLTAEQLTEHQKIRHSFQDRLLKKRSIIQSQSVMQPYYRLKCPDCSALFHSTEDILTHRKTSESCSGSYDPLKSVNVEVLIRPGPTSKNLDGDDTAFTTVHAIMDLPQAVFVCDIDNCGGVQYSLEDMEAHKKLHGSFPCNFCEVTLSSAIKLSIHELKHFKKEKNMKRQASIVHFCPRCDFKGERLERYIRHHVSTHLLLTVNEPVCAICKTHSLGLSHTPSEHTHHFKKMHDLSNVTIPEDIQRCTMSNCQAYFLSTEQLGDHLWYRHNVVTGRQALRHQRRHPTSDSPSSSKSVKTTEEQSKTKRTTLHKCRDCGKSYTLARKLWAHRAALHVDPDKVFTCTYPKCNKIFESIKQLKQHQRRGTRYHNELDNRDKEKVYVQCPKCKKSINGKHPNYLASHMKSHERSHFCQLCGKVFKSRPVLDMHLLYHSGPESWKFECSICGQKTKNKYSLAKHVRRHTNEKPYVCQICGLKYADRHNLRFHVNNKHGDVTEDKAKKIDTSNRMSTKGIKKRKKAEKDQAREKDAEANDNDSCDDN